MSEQSSKPVGRPSKFSQDLADEICSLIADGKNLRKICRENEHFPAWQTVYHWEEKYPEFKEAILRAREVGFHAIAHDTIDISDDGSNDTYLDAEGNERVATDVIQRSKLRVETRLKLLSKWCPRIYGDRIDSTLTHEAGDTLTQFLDKVRKS